LFRDNQRKVAAEAFNLENKERMKANQSKGKEKELFTCVRLKYSSTFTINYVNLSGYFISNFLKLDFN
jgi:hypothetical protein